MAETQLTIRIKKNCAHALQDVGLDPGDVARTLYQLWEERRAQEPMCSGVGGEVVAGLHVYGGVDRTPEGEVDFFVRLVSGPGSCVPLDGPVSAVISADNTPEQNFELALAGIAEMFDMGVLSFDRFPAIAEFRASGRLPAGDESRAALHRELEQALADLGEGK